MSREVGKMSKDRPPKRTPPKNRPKKIYYKEPPYDPSYGDGFNYKKEDRHDDYGSYDKYGFPKTYNPHESGISLWWLVPVVILFILFAMCGGAFK